MPPRHDAIVQRIDFDKAQDAGRIGQSNVARPISLPIVTGLVRLFDAVAVVVTGIGFALCLAPASLTTQAAILFACLGAITMANIAQLFGAYRHDMRQSLIASMTTALASWIVAMSIIATLVMSTSSLPSATEWLGTWAVSAAALLAASRSMVRASLQRWRRRGRLQRKAFVLGAGPIAQKLILKLTSASPQDVRILGVYDDRATRVPRYCLGHPILGSVDDLVRDARAAPIDCIFVALPLSADWRLVEIMNKLSLIPTDVRLCVDTIGFQIGTCDVTHVDGLTMLNVCDRPLQGWRHIAKIIEDRLIGAIILVAVAPIMAAAAILIKLDSPGPILFRQKRYGLNNELIEVLKFRTLFDEARDPNAERLCGDNDPRVTRVGNVLRRTMIDELPQFINVMHGEMSIVGPRPHALAAKAGGLLYREVVKYYDARHRMKPGITGWAQINGWRGETRTAEEIDQRVAHDLYYIQNWSILFDLRIILWTALGAVLSFVPRKPRKPVQDAVPVADAGRSRSAA